MCFEEFGGGGWVIQILSCDSLFVTLRRLARGTNPDLWNPAAQISLQRRCWGIDSFALFMFEGMAWRQQSGTPWCADFHSRSELEVLCQPLTGRRR